MLCVGPTGTGKTLTISDKLLKNLPLEYVSHFLTFSARTSANQTQDLIDSKLDKRQAPRSFLCPMSSQPGSMSCFLSFSPSYALGFNGTFLEGPGLLCRLLLSHHPSGAPTRPSPGGLPWGLVICLPGRQDPLEGAQTQGSQV